MKAKEMTIRTPDGRRAGFFTPEGRLLLIEIKRGIDLICYCEKELATGPFFPPQPEKIRNAMRRGQGPVHIMISRTGCPVGIVEWTEREGGRA